MKQKPAFAFQRHLTDECDQRCKHCHIFANAGGGQRSMAVAVRNAELAARIGRMNMAGFGRVVPVCRPGTMGP